MGVSSLFLHPAGYRAFLPPEKLPGTPRRGLAGRVICPVMAGCW